MNIPIPSSVARSGSTTSIHSPCRSAMARASSADAGLTPFDARFDRVRQFALGDGDPALRSPARSAVGAQRDEDQLIEMGSADPSSR
jgi:hypothetical protein